MHDPIADLLIRIKNGYQARKKVVVMPYSKIKESLAQILVKNGYLKNLKVNGKKPQTKELSVELKYKGKKPIVNGIKIISKPGLRVYKKTTEIPRVKLGDGITVISTPKGLLIDKEARKNHLGGEVICQIW